MSIQTYTYSAVIFLAMGLSACNGNSGVDPGSPAGVSAVSSPSVPNSPASSTDATLPPPPTANPRTFQIDALIFNGSGTWAAEVSSLQNILSSHGASFQLVNSAQLEAMNVDDLAKFLVFPGGAGGTEAGSVSAAVHAHLRTAVQQRGVSYLGFCAGTFIAQAPAPSGSGDVSYGFGVVAGPVLDYYYLENQGTDIAMTLETFADGTKADILWYGGPVTPNTPGGVIAKYPDGNPAMTELWSGLGLVILSGPHPTATQSTLNALGMASTDGVHPDIAWKLLNAAIHSQPLPAF
jgi:glutamine amidotransferase-like uncharacterized protein